MDRVQELDVVKLRCEYQGWAEGTLMTVLEVRDLSTALVEVVNPDGSTAYMAHVPASYLATR